MDAAHGSAAIAVTALSRGIREYSLYQAVRLVLERLWHVDDVAGLWVPRLRKPEGPNETMTQDPLHAWSKAGLLQRPQHEHATPVTRKGKILRA